MKGTSFKDLVGGLRQVFSALPDRRKGKNLSYTMEDFGLSAFSDSAVTPVIVAPGKSEVLALRPEFITPRDGHTKQDCELAASKRWLTHTTSRYLCGTLTLLGDDLYAHQPFCRQTLLHGFHFLFTCKPDSHKTLYRWLELLKPGPDLGTLK